MSEFGEWLKEYKTRSEEYRSNPDERVPDGGYLVPEYLNLYKSGIIPSVWRFIGKRFGREDWYRRGVETLNLAEELRKVLRS